MISVTESAKEELKRISSQVLDKPETVLRLIADEQRQLRLVVDSEKEGDQVVGYQEATVLVVDKELSAALEGVCVDYQDAADGPRLVLIRSKPEEAAGQD